VLRNSSPDTIELNDAEYDVAEQVLPSQSMAHALEDIKVFFPNISEISLGTRDPKPLRYSRDRPTVPLERVINEQLALLKQVIAPRSRFDDDSSSELELLFPALETLETPLLWTRPTAMSVLSFIRQRKDFVEAEVAKKTQSSGPKQPRELEEPDTSRHTPGPSALNKLTLVLYPLSGMTELEVAARREDEELRALEFYAKEVVMKLGR